MKYNINSYTIQRSNIAMKSQQDRVREKAKIHLQNVTEEIIRLITVHFYL